MLHDDDAPVGRVLSRREALILLAGAGAGGLLWVSGCNRGGATAGGTASTASVGCVAKPEMTEGPYFVDEGLTRDDIRTDTKTGKAQAGALFTLGFKVSRIGADTCTPLEGAVVDVWHCNALGVYSDVRDPQFDTRGQNWLRGNLLTDAAGAATFTTVFPGWYPGRAAHIHFKIRSPAGGTAAHEFTSQLFFDESFLASVYGEREPYRTKADGKRRLNADDGIFSRGGTELMLRPEPAGDGYAATFDVGLDLG